MSETTPTLILEKGQLIGPADVHQFAWAGLKSFQSVALVAEILREFHKATRSQSGNVRKQAQQIRDCLVQAREYSDASKIVSLATKPLLAYYSTMNLALVEILFKQTGESSLDRAREHHRHHGLTMPSPAKRRPTEMLPEAASALIAKPAFNGSERMGTFELWHRTARPNPLCGSTKDVIEHLKSIDGFNVLLRDPDQRMPLVPSTGMSLFEVMTRLPELATFLSMQKVQAQWARVDVRQEFIRQSARQKLSYTVQPTDKSVLDKILDAIIVEARGIEYVNVEEFPTGVRLSYEVSEEFNFRVEFPSGTTVSEGLTVAWPSTPAVNEFGLFYIGLFLGGMYSRYYPDYWMADVDAAHPLALGIEELVHQADTRVPLLTLSELRRTYLVPE